MANLIDKIREFGTLSYDSGVHERELSFVEKADLAAGCFKEILHFLGGSETAISVPCLLCSDSKLNGRNFCHFCGRDLREMA